MAAPDAAGFAIDYAGGTGFRHVTYSAFGEVLDAAGQPGGSVPAGFPRYQYAGGFGYESDLLSLPGVNPNLAPITLQHLGWRWYAPATGRFVQRDPIGVEGGLNTFGYVGSNPIVQVDPPATGVWIRTWRWVRGKLVAVLIELSSRRAKPRPPRPVAGRIPNPYYPRARTRSVYCSRV